MSKLKPIGSEKLQGTDKIKRIMEIAKYNTPNSTLTESTQDYSINLVDGMTYHIVKEKQGYIIKKGLTESTSDYIEPMKNRKYYSSYSQALKRLNLVIKEVNTLNGNDEGTELFGEQKKFVFKTKKAEVDVPAAPSVPAEPPMVPEPALPAAPADDVPMDDMPADDMAGEDLPPMDDEMEVDAEMDVEEPADDEEVTFKTIQKLTGKLTQKMRTFDNAEGMTSEDIKYVINMVLSAVDLTELSEEDLEDIMSKLEGAEEEGADMGMEDEIDVEEPAMGDDMEGEVEIEEPTESYSFENAMSESKIDKVLSKYFEVSDSEVKQSKLMYESRKNEVKTNAKKSVTQIERLSETIEQELSAKKFLEENNFYNFIGKTNKNNLVFEYKNKQVRISEEGLLL
jgi:hypothetical protein